MSGVLVYNSLMYLVASHSIQSYRHRQDKTVKSNADRIYHSHNIFESISNGSSSFWFIFHSTQNRVHSFIVTSSCITTERAKKKRRKEKWERVQSIVRTMCEQKFILHEIKCSIIRNNIEMRHRCHYRQLRCHFITFMLISLSVRIGGFLILGFRRFVKMKLSFVSFIYQYAWMCDIFFHHPLQRSDSFVSSPHGVAVDA